MNNVIFRKYFNTLKDIMKMKFILPFIITKKCNLFVRDESQLD